MGLSQLMFDGGAVDGKKYIEQKHSSLSVLCNEEAVAFGHTGVQNAECSEGVLRHAQ